MTFLCDSKYLIFPASHHAQNKRIYFYIDEELVYDFVMPLDYDEPDYEFYLNVERYHGKNISISCDCEIDIKIQKSDVGVSSEQAYTGKYRPIAHFTSKRGWINDPNGLVYYHGKYLMFYQHNPVACTWENMHWGYAVSDDLIHWEEKDIALYPDKAGTVFSGSAIIDHKNVTGLQTNDNEVILLFYTAAGNTSEVSKGKPFTQALAYSTDGGKTFVKYDKNPLIEQVVSENRDPKVIYYEPTDCYILALYLDKHDFALYSSKNLLDWTPLQKIALPEDAECPDFYPLAVDGNADNRKWVLIGASDRYYIGSFDGTKFTPETELKRLNYGNSSYAAQSWSEAPNGRRIRTAFVSVVIPGMPFGSCMDIPQEMTLKTINNELYLCAEPVAEISKLYNDTKSFHNLSINRENSFSFPVNGKCFDISLTASLTSDTSWKLSLFGFHLAYNSESSELSCLDKTVKVIPKDDKLEVRMIIDTIYTEIFTNNGSAFMGMTYIQDSNLNTLKIESTSNVSIDKLTLSELHPFR